VGHIRPATTCNRAHEIISIVKYNKYWIIVFTKKYCQEGFFALGSKRETIHGQTEEINLDQRDLELSISELRGIFQGNYYHLNRGMHFQNSAVDTVT
jgi:hypothetical protein